MKKYSIFSRKVKVTEGLYDYSSAESREDTVCDVLENARLARSATDTYWKKMRRYYDGLHDINFVTGTFSEDMKLPWSPAQSSDGYIHVESQIDPEIPGFEFSPKDDCSAFLAKTREETVRNICDENDISHMNIKNERRLNIYGSAVWKIGWGEGKVCGKDKTASVVLENPKPEQIFTDPSSETVDGGEYIAYVYPMHKQRAARVFEKDFKQKNENLFDYLSVHKHSSFFDSSEGEKDDCVTITEFWFKQPKDGKEYGESFAAGDVALSVLINGREIKYIPKYWKNTSCNMFPFVIYGKVPNDGSIWGKSELEQLVPLIDAADRELTFAQLNSAFSSNDVILAEENAFSDDETPDNSPGAVWKLRPGMMGRVQRLGNMGGSQASQFGNYTVWQTMMEQTTGNFEISQGKEPTRVTTASGIALLNERAKSRLSLKKTGKSEGFKRLYSLIDYTALEFSEDVTNYDYTPKIDIKIHIGDGIANSKAFTVSAINTLMTTPITEDNYMFVMAYVDLIGLPMRKEICDRLSERFGNDGTKESISAEDLLNEKSDAEMIFNV